MSGRFAFVAICLVWTVVAAGIAFAEGGPQPLPPARTDGGKPLMQCLKARRSARQFDPARPLPDQVLSDLLWAAFGINRPETGKRTAPSAVNWQEIDIYVATASGVYLYDPRAHGLKQVLAEDVRSMAGVQKFMKEAPVSLIYVADFARMKNAKEQDRIFYSAADVGFISQNVYLFCASEGLNTVVVGMVEREPLAAKLGLKPEQRILLTQPVGYPPEP